MLTEILPNITGRISNTKIMNGKAMIASITRIRISSNQPPKYAAQSPTMVPPTMPIAVAAGASSKTSLLPAKTRLRTSRPK